MLEEQIQMVDLHGQYLRFKEEIDEAMQVVIDSCAFINGPQVKTFAGHLADYLQVPYVIPCAGGCRSLYLQYRSPENRSGCFGTDKGGRGRPPVRTSLRYGADYDFGRCLSSVCSGR